MSFSTAGQIERQKPRALRPGDTVGIVAPASNIKGELLEQGCARLAGLGYKPFYLDSILERDLYFAGSAARRAREMEEMFTRPDVRAVLCARGGYGANYLLGELSPSKIVTNPKIFVGYSDITTLLTCFADSAGFVTFHGPMVAKDFAHDDGVDLASWEAALTASRSGRRGRIPIPKPKDWSMGMARASCTEAACLCWWLRSERRTRFVRQVRFSLSRT